MYLNSNCEIGFVGRFLGPFLLLLVFSVQLIFPESVYSQSKLPPLAPGMRAHNVIQLWGQPVEKEEREVSRKEIWHYKDGKVVFTEGKLTSWNSTALSTGLVEPAALPTPKSDKPKVESSPRTPDPTVMEEIMAEIMREPQHDTSESKGAAGAAVPPPVNVVRPPDIAPPEPMN